MPKFEYTFEVDAPVEAVSAFHSDTSVLKKLTPFPMIVQIDEFEPLGEGSEAKFTIWAGPLPLRWHSVHSDVSVNGFTDTQLSGPLKSWQHKHQFEAMPDGRTRVRESITYEHDTGLRGLISRIGFSSLGLTGLFTARKLLTQRYVAEAVNEINSERMA